MHKSGFVNIIGKPNVGKSTLMNALVGERMSIITNKPQTTRHRIIGIVSAEDFQIVFSDTPGYIDEPSYKMQEKMNHFVETTFEDADLMLFVTAVEENYKKEDPIVEKLQNLPIPVYLVINKVDTVKPDRVLLLIQQWNEWVNFKETIPISALNKMNTDKLQELILDVLPEGPVYYPKDQLTDRSERFFISEIIREKILELYKQEVPYSCEVIVDSFKEDHTKRGEELVRIAATIFVMRKTQKAIIIGKDGTAIKRLGAISRAAIEQFLEKKVYMELTVKVRDNWRDDDNLLKGFGYV